MRDLSRVAGGAEKDRAAAPVRMPQGTVHIAVRKTSRRLGSMLGAGMPRRNSIPHGCQAAMISNRVCRSAS